MRRRGLKPFLQIILLCTYASAMSVAFWYGLEKTFTGNKSCDIYIIVWGAIAILAVFSACALEEGERKWITNVEKKYFQKKP